MKLFYRFIKTSEATLEIPPTLGGGVCQMMFFDYLMEEGEDKKSQRLEEFRNWYDNTYGGIGDKKVRDMVMNLEKDDIKKLMGELK